MWSELLELLGEVRNEIRNIDSVLLAVEHIVQTLAHTGHVSLDELITTVQIAQAGGSAETQISPED